MSEARAKLATIMEEVSQSREPCFIASRSRVKAVLLGIDEYDALMDRLEDLEDSLDVLRSRLEAEPARPVEEFVRELETRRERDVQRPA